MYNFLGKKVLYSFYKSVSFELAVETCDQLGGQIPLPKNLTDISDVIKMFNDQKKFEKECKSKIWIPGRYQISLFTFWRLLFRRKTDRQ